MKRWWAPDKPADEPDDVVRAALLPMNDGTDLTSVLLALHRAAAASVHSRVESGLIDEYGLVEAMAKAREKIADDAVDSLSGQMDKDAAVKLIADYCDQAEAGALHLFRVAVSQGVAPPSAAHRAAAIYGVPKGSLRTYAGLAASSTAKEANLTHAADKALMSYLMRTFAGSQDVSKSEMTPSQKAEFERKHPRDKLGQFAEKPESGGINLANVLERSREVAARAQQQTRSRVKTMDPRARLMETLGISESIPSGLKVVVEPEPEAKDETKPKAATESKATVEKPKMLADDKKLSGKTLSDKKALGGQKTLAQSRTLAPKTKALSESKSTLSTKGSKLKQQQNLVTQVLGDLSLEKGALKPKPRPRNVTDPRPTTSSLLDHVSTGPRITSTINSPVVSYVNWSQWAETNTKAHEEMIDRGGFRKVGRLGNLLPNQEQQHMFDSYIDISHAMDSAAEEDDYRSGGNSVVRTEPVTYEEVDRIGGSIPAGSIAARDELRSLVRERMERLEAQMSLEGVNVHAVALQEYTRPGAENDSDVAMHIVAAADGGETLPGITELVFHDARGEIVGTGRDGYVELDGEQIYEMRSLERGAELNFSGVDGHTSSMMWDPERKVVVNRVHLYPVDDDEVTKAAALSGQMTVAEQVEFERKHPRDDLGQFTTKGSGTATKLKTRPQQKQSVEVKPAEKKSLKSKPKLKADRLLDNKKTLAGQRLVSESSTALKPQPAKLKRSSASLQESRLRRSNLTKPSAMIRIKAEAKLRAEMPKQTPRKFVRTPLFLPPDHSYQVRSQDSWVALAESMSDEDLMDLHMRRGSVRLSNMAKRTIAEGGMSDATGAYLSMGAQVDDELVSRGFEGEPDGMYAVPISGEISHDELMANVSSILESHPGAVQINVIDRGDELEFSWVEEDIGEQVIIDIPPDFDPDADYRLTYVGTFEARDMHEPSGQSSLFGDLMEDTVDVHGEGVIINPIVRAYKVDRYRMDEER